MLEIENIYLETKYFYFRKRKRIILETEKGLILYEKEVSFVNRKKGLIIGSLVGAVCVVSAVAYFIIRNGNK